MGLRRAGRALAGWLEKQRLERASNPGRLYARAHASHRLGAQKNRLSVGDFGPASRAVLAICELAQYSWIFVRHESRGSITRRPYRSALASALPSALGPCYDRD